MQLKCQQYTNKIDSYNIVIKRMPPMEQLMYAMHYKICWKPESNGGRIELIKSARKRRNIDKTDFHKFKYV